MRRRTTEVGGRLALPYIRQMNRVSSRSDLVTTTAVSTINIIRVLLFYFNFIFNPR